MWCRVDGDDSVAMMIVLMVMIVDDGDDSVDCDDSDYGDDSVDGDDSDDGDDSGCGCEQLQPGGDCRGRCSQAATVGTTEPDNQNCY